MRVLLSACLLVSLATSALAAGQKHDLVTIGDSRISQGTFNGTDEKPFLAAVAAMNSGYGGQIEVLPGRYRFNASVVVNRYGVTIRGSRGVVIDGRSLSGDMPAFLVTADGVRFDGLHFLAGNPGTSGSLLRVEGDDFALTHCRFDVLDSKSAAFTQRVAGVKGNNGAGYRLVHALPGPTTSGENRQGTLLEGNSFVFGKASAGVIGFESENGSSLRLNANEFIGDESVAGMVPIGAAVLLRNGVWATISGNTFLRLAAPSGLDQEHNAILASISSGSAEGHHLSITGNFFEELQGRTVINLAGGKYNVISGNVFGRTLTPEGCVRLDSAPGAKAGTLGTGNVVTGNQFHHHSGGYVHAYPAIVVRNQERTSITSNQFTDCAGPQVIVGSAGAPAFGAFVVGNQFAALECNGNPPVGEAIQFLSGSMHFAATNVVIGDGQSQSPCGWLKTYNAFGTASVQDGSGNAVIP